MKKQELKVSIITPSYMQGQFIEDCILSVKNQTYKNIEHIILDNLSSDNTDTTVKKYLDKYNLTYICKKDRGQANAINVGLEKATGDIVCWLNADDYYYENSVIQKIVAAFIQNNAVDVISANGYFADQNKKQIKKVYPKRNKRYTLKDLSMYDPFLQPATFWRKNSIKLDEDLKYTFDWKLWIDFLKRDFQILLLDDCIACYRWHTQGKTYSNSSERKKETIIVQRYGNAKWFVLLWSYIIYTMYIIAEKTGLKVLIRILSKINDLICKILKFEKNT